MTRKHFIATAAIVSQISNNETRKFTANNFADWFSEENPRFDRSKFIAACGVKS